MKRMVVLSLSLVVAGSSFSQQKTVVIQQGSVLDYVVHAPNGEVPVSALLSKVSEEEVRFDWTMELYSGIFRTPKASLDSARYGYWNEPIDGQDLTMDDNRCLLQLSKACWKDIRENRPMVFGSGRYTLAPMPVPFQVGGQIIDCLYLASDNGSYLWVANNEKLPMILKIENNRDGVDIELVAVR